MTPAPLDRRWAAGYSAVLAALFVPLHLWTRLPLFVSDSATVLEEARLADPRHPLFGFPGHFLQMPLAAGLWHASRRLGLPFSLEAVWLGLCLAGTLAAIISLGLIAAELLQTRLAAWLAALLFGTSLNMWWQWNGELYALALGFVTAGVLLALRRHLVAAALCYALAVSCHIDFVFAGPAFAAALAIGRPDGETIAASARRIGALLAGAGLATLFVLIVPNWMMGKWRSTADVSRWLTIYFGLGKSSGHVLAVPEIFRASKGLLTAYTVAGHYWRDILTRRAVDGSFAFVAASAVGLVVLIVTAVLLAAAIRRRSIVLLSIVWLGTFQLLFNWWFCPNDSKYHAGALPGFVLLVVTGLVHLTARMTGRARYALCASYVVMCAGLNLWGSLLPMQALGHDTLDTVRQIRQLNDDLGGNAVIVSCTDSLVVVRAGVANFRIKKEWRPTVTETRDAIRSWIDGQLAEGKQPFLLDRWCLPEEWFVSAPPPFDLYFLEKDFQLVPTQVRQAPVAQVWETNPFSWRRGALMRLVPLRRSSD